MILGQDMDDAPALPRQRTERLRQGVDVGGAVSAIIVKPPWLASPASTPGSAVAAAPMAIWRPLKSAASTALAPSMGATAVSTGKEGEAPVRSGMVLAMAVAQMRPGGERRERFGDLCHAGTLPRTVSRQPSGSRPPAPARIRQPAHAGPGASASRGGASCCGRPRHAKPPAHRRESAFPAISEGSTDAGRR